jgi:hypothetical protein
LAGQVGNRLVPGRAETRSPAANGHYPDFVVIAPDLGVLIVEVKGWY